MSGLVDLGLGDSGNLNMVGMIDKIVERITKQSASFGAKHPPSDDSALKPVNIVITESVKMPEANSIDNI
jgi:hypothetical protein